MYFFMQKKDVNHKKEVTDKRKSDNRSKNNGGSKIGTWSLVLLLTGTVLLQTVSFPVTSYAKENNSLEQIRLPETEGAVIDSLFTTTSAIPQSLYSTAAVLMDADTGRVLFEKNGDAFMANASTTKILTCIVALENASLEEVVTVSAYAASMPKVKLYIKEGEHYTLQDLLFSLMLESHNDSAVAIAEHVGGSMEGFAAMMNEKAKEIGCNNSYFITPNGLDATESGTDISGNEVMKEHGTTAEELSKIMAYCAFFSPMKDTFLKITRTASYSFTNQEGRSFQCTNHNTFLNMMEGALTGKTGFTNKAGYCYVGALERDGKRFTIALLACGWPNNKTWKWADAKTLFTYGLENFTYKMIEEVEPDGRVYEPIPVLGGQTEGLDDSVSVPVEIQKGEGVERLLLGNEEEISVYWETKEQLLAPVSVGTQVGFVRYMVGDTVLREDKILAGESVEKIDYLWCLKKIVEKFIL